MSIVAPSSSDLPSLDFRLVWVTTPAELEAHMGPWKRLVETALEANVFFGPEMLMPALEELRSGSVRIGMVLSAPRQDTGGAEVLSALFPVKVKRGRAEMWQHRYAFQGTPLLRSDVAREACAFFLSEALGGEAAIASLLRCPTLRANGAAAQILYDVSRVQGYPMWHQDLHARAEFRPAETAESFAAQSISRKVRRNLKRDRKLLEKRGAVESEVERVGGDKIEAWCDRFLTLEASGWKGRGSTAMQSKAQDQRWFRRVAEGLAAEGRFVGSALRLDGTAIAMGVMLVDSPAQGADEAVFFKIAHDEAMAGISLGALLQWVSLDGLHGACRLATVDSCAIPGHPMIERIWHGRRMVGTSWIASGSRWSRLKLWLFQGAYGLKAARRKAAKP